MKTIKYYIDKGLKGSEVVAYNYKTDFPKEAVLKFKDDFINNIKKDYPNAEFIDILVTDKPKIDKAKLMRIGQEVASGWGAVCTGVKTYPNSVMFECNEYGEKFTTHLSYDYINKEYNYVK